jgi:hypothetical protein
MPVMHVSESYRPMQHETTPHDAAPPALPPVPTGLAQHGGATGDTTNAREVAGRGAASATHFIGERGPSVQTGIRTEPPPDRKAVLRLRGGGGKSSKSDTDGEPLIAQSASTSYRAHHGGASETGEARVRNMAKRYELEGKLGIAKNELATAKQKFGDALSAVDTARARLARLEEERAGFGLDPARRDEIERQMSAANDDYQSKTFAAWPYRTAVERCEKECRQLQAKLDKLPWA